MLTSSADSGPRPRADSRPVPPARETRRRLLQAVLVLLAAGFAVLYAFERWWGDYTRILYDATGLIGAGLVGFSIFRGRFHARFDTFLLILFFALAWFSDIYNYGNVLSFPLSRNFCIWMVFLALYYAVQIAPDPQHWMRFLAAASSLALSVLCLSVLITASASLLSEHPQHDTLRGCFVLGRLCGLNNANHMGFSCIALLLFSVFGRLATARRIRFLYSAAAGIGWFCLGLTGSRTGSVGVSFALGLFVFSLFFGPSRLYAAGRPVVRFLAASFAALSVFSLALASFQLPGLLYRAVMTLWGRAAGNGYLLHNLSSLVVRKVFDNDETLTGRTFIWARSIEECLRNPRRFLIGISPLSSEAIGGVLEGHHEVLAAQAHNYYLEMLRRYGLFGFLTWMTLLFSWCASGIQTLFFQKTHVSVRYLIACAAGILVMGMAEPVPFSSPAPCSLAILFFSVCGYSYRLGRNKQ